MYNTFIRTWRKVNKAWPDGLEPGPGRKYYQQSYDTEEQARDACQKYNRTHPAGKLSRKMEYERA